MTKQNQEKEFEFPPMRVLDRKTKELINGSGQYVILDGINNGTYAVKVQLRFSSSGYGFLQNPDYITVDDEHRIFYITLMTNY